MKLKFITLYLILASLNLVKAQDTIILNGTNKVSFKLKNSIYYYFPNCKQNFVAGTSIRTITGMGKLQVYQSGEGYIIPYQKYIDSNGSTFVYYYRNGCSFGQSTITFKNKDVITIPDPTPDPIPSTGSKGASYTSSKYDWGRTIGNTSVNQYGDKLIRGLRTPTGVAELNGSVYFTTGLAEGNSAIIKVVNQIKTEILPPINNDFTLNATHIVSDGTMLFVAGFDSYGAIKSAVIGIKNDNEFIFTTGKPFSCLYQDNPYKSGIHLNKEKVTDLDVDETTLYVYCGAKCYQYNKVSGALISTVNVPTPNYIAKSVKGSDALEMTSTQVTYNGKVICRLQTTPKVENNTFIPRDFNHYITKGSVAIGKDFLYVCDAGNCRTLIFDKQGNYKSQIAYLPMNYNCAVNKTNPTQVFAKELEFKISYPDMTWTLVNNWGVNLSDKYIPSGDNKVFDFMRDVTTVNGVTTAFIIYHETEWERRPALMKLTTNGLELIKLYDVFENVSQTHDGKIVTYVKEGGKAKFYLDGVLKETVNITSNSALNSDLFVSYTSDGSFVVYHPEKSHTGFHLTWVKNGQIKNAMPTKNITQAQARQVPFMSGDFYPLDTDVEYGGGKMYVIDNKVFVNYIGEFFGGSGGQTNLWWQFENGVFVDRYGMTVFESEALDGKFAPRVASGNSYGGGLTRFNNNLYIITNCEHTGALQWFLIK